MLYICADDYGLCAASDAQILRSAQAGAVNKISIFANHVPDTLPDLSQVCWSVHLNLSEGRALCDSTRVLTDAQGNFKYDFIGLLRLSLGKKRKAMEAAVEAELKAQIANVRTLLSYDTPLWIDSHQHIHMIPLIFKVLLRLLKTQKIPVRYLRFPAEPFLPYVRTPELYLSYTPVGLAKQWLLKLMGAVNGAALRRSGIPTAHFMGVLFSGNMDIGRVNKVLLQYQRLAKRKGGDIEVLLHPGGCAKDDIPWRSSEKHFTEFYTAAGRRTELETAMVLKNIQKEGI